ncbi:MAG: inosine/xanthosine triphosphatase [Bacteroidia bacterium]|nr:inosine/xanthosine triphosphatase [Bacteroidia bacterium]
MQLIIASRNPIKVNASLKGFQAMFPQESFEVEGVSVASDVSDQPMSDTETLQGAINRAHHAKELYPKADFWVGIEGGLEEREEDYHAFAWVYVLSHTQKGQSRSASFQLPPQVCQLIRQGMELGDADDVVFGSKNSKQANGAVGLLSGDAIVRETLYIPAVTLALVPFRNQDLFRQE